MRKIGLIDYYLDEYHAHEAFVSLQSLGGDKTGFTIVSAYAEKDSDSGLTTDAFCKQHGIKRADSIAELCGDVDCLMILSPDDNDKKEGYAIEAIKYGKPIFMDKTFTDSYESAVRIFDAADKAGVPLFSSSSLRYASELQPYKGDATSVLAFGSGVKLDLYLVHYLEIVYTCMGAGVEKVRHEQRGNQEWAHIYYRDGRCATVVISIGEHMDFQVLIADSESKTNSFSIVSPIFRLQMEMILDFFNKGKASFDRAETLELMRTIDAIKQSKREAGAFVVI